MTSCAPASPTRCRTSSPSAWRWTSSGTTPETFGHYYDTLTEQALGNYTDLVREVSMSPAMGLYLSHLGNRRADEEMGLAPDENFARELMQLFTIGLEDLNRRR